MSVTDQSIIQNIRDGDVNAFGKLVDRYHTRISGIVISRLPDWSGVDDVVQQSFIEAYNNLARLNEPEQFGSWLTGIALNLCRKWMQQYDRAVIKSNAYEHAMLHEATDMESTVEKDFTDKEIKQRISRTIRDLEEHLRDIIILRYLEECTYKEIADRLEVPESTVQSRLRIAHERLREELLPVVTDVLHDIKPKNVRNKVVSAILPLPNPFGQTPTTPFIPWTGGLVGLLVVLAAATGIWIATDQQTAQGPISEPAQPSTPDAWIQAEVRKNLPEINRIYAGYLENEPILNGQLTFEIDITGSGNMTEVRLIKSSMENDTFEADIRNTILKWQFSPLDGYTGGTITITLPFAPFTPTS